MGGNRSFALSVYKLYRRCTFCMCYVYRCFTVVCSYERFICLVCSYFSSLANVLERI